MATASSANPYIAHIKQQNKARCPTCGGSADLACSRCHGIKYCSKDCQTKDWKSHKLLCSSYKDFQNRPEEGMRRVIFFLAGKNAKPEFRWITIVTELDQLGTHVLYQNVELDLMGPGGIPMSLVIKENAITKQMLITESNTTKHIHLYYDDVTARTEATKNGAVVKATQKQAPLRWYGQLLAHCGLLDPNMADRDIVDVQDISMDDYAAIVAHFIKYGSAPHRARYPGEGSREGSNSPIEGVQICCTAERMIFKTPEYESIPVEATGEIYHTAELCEISVRINKPLLITKCNTREHRYTSVLFGFQNPITSSSALYSIDPSGSTFASNPIHWEEQVGNVIILNLEHKPLQLHEVQGFLNYCRYHLKPHFEWATEKCKEDPENAGRYRQLVLSQITPQKYLEYQMQFVARAGQDDEPEVDEKGRKFVHGVLTVGIRQQNGVQIKKNLDMMSPEEYIKVSAPKVDGQPY